MAVTLTDLNRPNSTNAPPQERDGEREQLRRENAWLRQMLRMVAAGSPLEEAVQSALED